MDRHEQDRLTENMKTAIDMLSEGTLCSVMLIGVLPGGRSCRVWSGGDERANDHLRDALVGALPVPAPARSPASEDDGA